MGDDATEKPERGYKNYKLTGSEKRGRARADMSGWRKQLQASKVKFDDTQKGIYLNVLKKTSLKNQAAAAAGVAMETIRRHREEDPDFAEAEQDALDAYRDIIIKHAHKVAVVGVKKPLLGGKDKDQVVAHEIVYATNILAMEMRRVEPTYKEKSEVELINKASVLIAPADMTPEDWIKAQQEQQGTKKEPGTE